MKKVLIVGYFWPFRNGSGRMLGLAKYLKEFGWEPIILTPPLWDDIDVATGKKVRTVITPFRGDIFEPIRKFLHFFGFHKTGITEKIQKTMPSARAQSWVEKIRNLYMEIIGYPDTEYSWLKDALPVARNLLASEKIDCILSVWPITSHLIAQRLQKEFDIPWIADFPDPWSENHAYPYGAIRKYFDGKLEEKTLRQAAAISAASPGYAQKESLIHKRNVSFIPIGFDEMILHSHPVPLTSRFTITYTGSIYKYKQDPIKFLRAIKNLVSLHNIPPSIFEVRFYGDKLEWLAEEINRLELNEYAHQKGRISKEEALIKQRESQLLLLFGWEDSSETGVYPLKTFEYLAACRPIVVTGGTKHEDMKKLINDAKAGIAAISTTEIEDVLFDFYKEYCAHGKVVYRGDSSTINSYSYKNTAKKFAALFAQCTQKKL